MTLCIATHAHCCCQPDDIEQPDETRFCPDARVATMQREIELHAAMVAKLRELVNDADRGTLAGVGSMTTRIEEILDASPSEPVRADTNMMARLREDAQRYRWLRDTYLAKWRPYGLRESDTSDVADAKVDAAMTSPERAEPPADALP